MRSSGVILCLISVVSITSRVGAWEFNTDGDTERWVGSNTQSVEAQDGKLIVSVGADTLDPYVTGPFGPYDANQIMGVYMRMRWSADATGHGGPAIYYFPSRGGHASTAYTAPDPNVWTTVFVDMLNEAEWYGNINQIRFDLADNVPEAYTVEVDWIRLESQYLDNESFEWGNMWGWDVVGDPDNFGYESDRNNVFSLSWALKVTGAGTGTYQALTQPVKDVNDLEAGERVALMGVAKVPAESWDGDSVLWCRVCEKNNANEENYTTPLAVPVFDEWFEFSTELTLKYDPADRQSLEVQLYSKNPEGKVFYLDDIFAEVLPSLAPDEDLYWPYNQTHWEFNTRGDAEGWSPKNDTDITYFDVNTVDADENPVGALLLDLPGGTFDPFTNGPVGPYYSTSFTGIAARMRFKGTESDMVKPADGGQHTVYWFYVDGGFANSPQFEIPAANEWFIAYIDCSAIWSGWVNNLRFDLGHYQNLMMVDIDWMRMYGNYIKNNGFEQALEPWTTIGAGFSLSSDQVQTGDTALKIEGQGIGVWHAVQQRVAGWDTKIPKGATVTVRGSYYVPASSWVEGSLLWLRVNELQAGTVNENLSPTPAEMAAFEPVLDAWMPFEGTITTRWEPSERGHLSVQLFSQMPNGAPIYVDDVFVTVEAVEPIPGWPVNCSKLAKDQQITIDGVIAPGEYAGAQPLVFTTANLTAADPYIPPYVHNAWMHPDSQQADPNDEDFNITYYLMWDDEFFYIAAAGKDDSYAALAAGDTPNHTDCLQVVLGETPGETRLDKKYIPTIAPADTNGAVLAKTDFPGWIQYPVAEESEKAGYVDPSTQDWVVEVAIPWSKMVGDFDGDLANGDLDGNGRDVFPPQVGDVVGFTCLGIDYDWQPNQLDTFVVNHDAAPWTDGGLSELRFTSPLIYDLNVDYVVDYRDLEVLVSEWLNGGADLMADFDGDGDVDFGDYARLAEAWLNELL